MPLQLKYSLIAAFLLALWGVHVYDKHQAVQEARNELIAQYDKKLLEATQKAVQTTKQLQADNAAIRGKKDEQIQDINSKLAAALSELRKRPKRPASLPNNPSTGEACTARELYQEDAEFLTREAARADSVLAERDYYYSQYESVRRRLDEASN